MYQEDLLDMKKPPKRDSKTRRNNPINNKTFNQSLIRFIFSLIYSTNFYVYSA